MEMKLLNTCIKKMSFYFYNNNNNNIYFFFERNNNIYLFKGMPVSSNIQKKFKDVDSSSPTPEELLKSR